MNNILYKIEPTDYTLTLRATHEKERFPIAYASIDIVEEDGIKVGKLVGMIRRQEYRGKGICRELVEKRIDLCKSLGCNKIYTAVYHKRMGLITLYKNLGFEEIEPITPEYVRLEKDLHL